VHDLDERVAVERPLAPVDVEVGEGFGGGALFDRFPGRLELAYPVRGRRQHVAKLREVGLGAEWAVARDDLRVAVRGGQQAVRRRDAALHAAASGAVDVRSEERGV